MRMHAFGFAAALLLFVLTSVAQALTPMRYYPKDFYDRVEQGMHDDDLKRALFTLLSSAHVQRGEHDQLADSCAQAGADRCEQHTSLGYTPARRLLFGDIHLRKTDQGYAIFDVYCETLNVASDFEHNPPGPGQIPDQAVLNTEHTWPQSHFSKRFPTELQKSDLHILYPVSSGANSSRSNLDFSDVTSQTSSPCAKSKRGYAGDGGSQQFFEPPDAHKGNVARAIFYFSIRYKMPVPATEEASLRTWNHMDPPDDFERARNDKIEAAQGERNPFIDYPELIDLISDF